MCVCVCVCVCECECECVSVREGEGYEDCRGTRCYAPGSLQLASLSRSFAY